MKEVKIPKNMGYGEGGETLPKLGKILQGIVGNINDLAARVEALEDDFNDLTERVEALEDEGEGEGGGDE